MLLLSVLLAGLLHAVCAKSSSAPLTIATSLQTSFFVGANRIPTALASNISEKCLKDTETYVNALYKQQPWATSSKLNQNLFVSLSNSISYSVRVFR